jgi:hypothetical protein
VSAPSAVHDEEPAAPPTAERPFPFTPWQYARLLMLRGRVQDGEVVEGREAEGESPPAGA